MAAPTFMARGIVLRKTKLGESDLIVTLLAEDGSQLRAVAKGARKPRSSFAARLELYSVVELLCAKGRNLDIVKEARLLESNEHLRRDMEHAASAAPIAELLERVTQSNLEHPRLFALTDAAFAHMSDSDSSRAPLLTAAHLLKALAFCGFRPSLSECIGCGRNVLLPESVDADAASGSMVAQIWFSYSDGGAVCDDCHCQMDVVRVPAAVMGWMNYLLHSTFDDIMEVEAETSVAFAVLEVCHQWIRAHVGANLKSLNFLFTCGLYE